MQLRHVRVRNIRSYEAGAVDFAPGTTLIAGDVGAGKTSLLYAIEMALFGTSEVDAAFLVRHGGTHAEVSVSFEDAEHRYEVVRRFRRVHRKGREAFEPEGISFSTDGAKTEYSATELRQRVIELLGFPDNPSPTAHSDLWRWAVYVPQERMRDILAAKPQERLETVRKALGVERYRIAAENAQDVVTDLRRTATSWRSEAELLRHFDEEFATASQEADSLRAERVAIEAAIADAEARARSVAAEVDALEAAARETEADRRELESVERDLGADARSEAELERRRGQLERTLAQREDDARAADREAAPEEEGRRELERAEADRAARRAELEAISVELRALEAARADRASAERRLAPSAETVVLREKDVESATALTRRLAESGPSHEPPAPTPDSVEVIDRRLDALRAHAQSTLAELARSQAAEHDFEELLDAGVCPRCGQSVETASFEPHRREIAGATAQADAAHAAAVREVHEAEEARRARERYDRAFDRWQQVERERAAARAARSAAIQRLEEAVAERARAQQAFDDAGARLEHLSGAEPRERAVRESAGAAETRRDRAAAEWEAARRAADRARLAREAILAVRGELERVASDRAAGLARTEARRRRQAELRARLTAAEPDAERLRAAQARRTELTARSEEQHRALVRTDTRLDGAVRRVRESERGRAERARRIAEAIDLEAKAAWLHGPFRLAVLAMEQKLLRHAQAAFDRHLTRYFATLIDDPALIARADAAFTPSVSIEGEWTPAEALSGGERTSLALAFRLALAQVVRALGSLRLDTILLDEPTDGFSPEQVVRMGELLNELALPQVILVSHEDALAGIADHVVRVVKVDGASTLRVGDQPATDLPPEPDATAPRPRRGRARLRKDVLEPREVPGR